MATLRQLLQGTQKVHPNAIKWAPDGNNSPLLTFEVQKFKGVNSLMVYTAQKYSGRWGKGSRAVSKDGIYKQRMRFTLKSEGRKDINKFKPKASSDKCNVNCQCFTGDTKVILTNGKVASFKELVGKEFYVYSLDNNNDVQISSATKCELKEKNANLVEVTLDNDFSIKCTLDHKFRLKDGSYKEAQYLKSGDSLAAIYRRYSGEYRQDTLKGYELVRGPKGNWKYSHHLADEYNVRFNVKDRLEYNFNELNFARHHVDFNKKNNNPDNIQRMGTYEHIKYHSQNANKMLKIHGNPIHRSGVLERMVNTKKKKGQYKEQSIKMKNNNPMFDRTISNKVGETKKKKGQYNYTKESPIYKNNKFHKKRENFRTFIRSLPIGVTKVDKELLKTLNQSSSSFGQKLRTLIKEEEFKDSIFIKKEARNKPINIVKTDGTNNHKIKSIRFLEEKEDVYCLTSEEFSNFAIVADNSESLESGIFVHNCDNYYYMWWWGNKKVKAHEGGNYKKYVRKTPPPPEGRPEVNPQDIPGICKHLVYVTKELKRKKLIQ